LTPERPSANLGAETSRDPAGGGSAFQISFLRPRPRRRRDARGSLVIAVAVVGEVRLYRDGLAHALEQEDEFACTGTAATLGEAVALVEDSAPDVALVDLAMADALETVRALTDKPEVAVVVLAVPDRDEAILACAEAGIAGLVTRDGSFSDLVEAISGAARGELATTPRVAGVLLRRVASLVAQQPADLDRRLTVREREIAGLLERGLSNKEIATKLCIEVATVKNHVHNILEKLDVGRRADVAAAFRGLRAGAEI
jgi:two-component system, NarL family, nitrate/nitrite response regulator NarL